MSRDMLAELFRDIRANPEDDVPRLILGDWLLDQGDPRGEFVQIDVRLAQALDDAERGILFRRRRELLRDHAVAWLGPLMDAVSGWDWQRGLLHLDARAAVLLDERNRPALRSPAFDWVESVTLDDAVPYLDRLSPSGILSHIRQLHLRFDGVGGWLLPLLAVQDLDRLKVLRLSQIGFSTVSPSTLNRLQARFGDRVHID